MMNRRTKARRLQEVLDRYYPTPVVPLHYTSLYTLLVAVILSAQCTDKRVNAVTPRLFSLADTPEKMQALSVSEIEEIIRPCGLASRKAKAIWQLSCLLVKNYQGRVPETFEELEALPGVGHKTASVVMVQGFGKAAFPVDTHIHRCARRWQLTRSSSVEGTEEDLKKLFPKTSWGRLHLQMIAAGREYCTAKSHHPALCPFCSALLEASEWKVI